MLPVFSVFFLTLGNQNREPRRTTSKRYVPPNSHPRLAPPHVSASPAAPLLKTLLVCPHDSLLQHKHLYCCPVLPLTSTSLPLFTPSSRYYPSTGSSSNTFRQFWAAFISTKHSNRGVVLCVLEQPSVSEPEVGQRIPLSFNCLSFSRYFSSKLPSSAQLFLLSFSTR